MNLKWIYRDGKKILQQSIDVQGYDYEKKLPYKREEWQDVPVEGMVDQELADAAEVFFPKLKKPESPNKPREWSLVVNKDSGQVASGVVKGLPNSCIGSRWELVDVTEVPKGSRVISREELAKAWDNAVDGTIIPRSNFPDNDEVFKPYFKYFLKELGFDNE